MSKKVELFGEELDMVNGGQITYTWDGNQGSIGIDGYNPFVLVNKAKFVAYYNAVKGTMSDAEILTNLFNQGVIRKPND